MKTCDRGRCALVMLQIMVFIPVTHVHQCQLPMPHTIRLSNQLVITFGGYHGHIPSLKDNKHSTRSCSKFSCNSCQKLNLMVPTNFQPHQITSSITVGLQSPPFLHQNSELFRALLKSTCNHIPTHLT